MSYPQAKPREHFFYKKCLTANPFGTLRGI